MARSPRDHDRLLPGPGAILSVQRAAELLPLDDQEARQWLADTGLVRSLLGRPVVVWRDVVDAVSTGGEPEPGPRPQPPALLPRKRLLPFD